MVWQDVLGADVVKETPADGANEKDPVVDVGSISGTKEEVAHAPVKVEIPEFIRLVVSEVKYEGWGVVVHGSGSEGAGPVGGLD